MSDGITDAYREQREHENYLAYLKAIGAWALRPSQRAERTVLRAVRMTNILPYEARNAPDKGLDWLRQCKMVPLRDNGHTAWLRLLAAVGQNLGYGDPLYAKLKAASPFAGRTLALVDAHWGKVGGELAHAIIAATQKKTKHLRKGQHYSMQNGVVIGADGTVELAIPLVE